LGFASYNEFRDEIEEWLVDVGITELQRHDDGTLLHNYVTFFYNASGTDLGPELRRVERIRRSIVHFCRYDIDNFYIDKLQPYPPLPASAHINVEDVEVHRQQVAADYSVPCTQGLGTTTRALQTRG